MTNLRFITRSSLVGLLLAGSVAVLPAHAESESVKASAAAVQPQEQKAPEQVVKDTVNEVITNIQTHRALYKKDSAALHQMIEDVLVPTLHVKRMAKLILGKRVASQSSDQQIEAFAEEFKNSLIKTYAAALLEYTGKEEVVYDEVKYKPSGDIAMVKGALVTADGQKYNIVLHMSNRNDTSWRAYNLEAAGINVLSTYRSTYSAVLQKKGLDGLIADLKEKNS